MLNVPKRANDAMHMSMLDGYDVRLTTAMFNLCVVVCFFGLCSRCSKAICFYA